MLKRIIFAICIQLVCCDLFNITKTSVIVWEKCGVEAKTQVTKIFEGSLDDGNSLEVTYNPLLNALKFKTKMNYTSKASILMLPDSIEVLMFTFQQAGSLNILTDCHRDETSNLQWSSEIPFLSLNYEVHDHTAVYPSINEAKRYLMCQKTVAVSAGAVFSFPPSALANSQLFTLTDEPRSYSISYKNLVLSIYSSDNEVIDYEFNKTTKDFSLYVILGADRLEFYTECPYKVEPEIVWNTTKFRTEIQFQSKKTHFIGTVMTEEQKRLFCMKSKYAELSDKRDANGTCQPIKELKHDFAYFQRSNTLFYYFLPTLDQMQSIDLFANLNLFNKESRISLTHPKITFASRSYAPPKFFARTIKEYVNGFTDGNLNFWIGLDALHKATTQTKFGLRIELEYNGFLYFEEYREVQIGNNSRNYEIKLTGPKPYRKDFHGQNNQQFSALDFNQKSIAKKYQAGFWFMPAPLPNFPTHAYYCFSCENGGSQNGTSTYYYIGPFFSFVTRMQLLLF